MIVHQYEKSYKGDSELDDYFRFKMASSANLRKSQDGISNLGYVLRSSSLLTVHFNPSDRPLLSLDRSGRSEGIIGHEPMRM